MPIAARPRAPRSLVVAGLALVVALGAAVPAAPAFAGEPLRTPRHRPQLRTFMEALAEVESGGRYTARNPSSGAYGRYQIMPFNWPAWARIYLGDRHAKPTPANQDKVAAGRLSNLRNAYGSWDRVAYWWLTGGKGPRSGWSDYATRYVVKVMTGFRLRIASPDGGQHVTVLGDRNQAILWKGRWTSAWHEQYTGGHAHSSKERGARVKIRFTGRSIAILGPVGPTRGKAAVLVDGRRVRTVDLRAGTYHPRRVLFETRWRALATHKVELVVLGTNGRPVVAVDRIVIRR
jgi:hypothetical protein